MNTTNPFSMIANLNYSPMLVTERGVGWWDAKHNEFRTHYGMSYHGKPDRVREPAEEEMRNYYVWHSAHRAEMCRYYDVTRETGD